jgi:hypothetical protein
LGKKAVLIDLDKTLAYHDKNTGYDKIGKPIEPMVKTVKALIKAGYTVRLFTARLSRNPGSKPMIRRWLEKQGLGAMEITDRKTSDVILILDDKARQVIENKGEIVIAKK